MQTYGIAQGTLFSAMWWRKYKKREDMYMYNWFICYTAETKHNLVKQLYASKNKLIFKK